jgi:hypothetical protein
MSLTVYLPGEVAARIEAIAAKRGLSVDQGVAEMLSLHLPADDALEAFIGSGASGRGEPFDIHAARRALAGRKVAEGA